ncbi:MAG TPA: carboxypeptidase regulatory-like domain-containing protein [Streptosporangiaceae bacterium]
MRKRLQRWAGYAALATGVATMAGLGLLAIAPAQASTAGYSSGSSLQAAAMLPAGSGAGGAVSTSPKTAESHYTNAPCNTTNLKANYATCFSMVYTSVKNQIAASPDQPPPTALGPTQIQQAYNLPASGQGETVGIVDAYGDSNAESDLATFRSYYGLPPCTTANGCFTKVAQDGSTNYPPDDDGWGLETSLDLDAISSACPNCHILLVEGNDNSLQNLGVAEDEAVSLGAKFVSNSYGVEGEDPTETQYDAYYEHPGVAVDAATGDTGDVVNWPASNPDVAAIGGTTLTQDPSVPRGWDESAWSEGGSGCSLYEPRPDYQDNITTDCPNNKATADISADADPNSGLATYDTLGYGGWLQVGGTSLATPLVTAMYALAGTPVPGTYPVTYPYTDPNQSNDLFDITTGDNGSCGNVLCTAGPGWDGPTGLGTPDGVNALTTGPHGTIAGEITDSSTGAPLSGATVTATGGFTATTDSSGDYSLTLPTGTYNVTATDFGYKSTEVDGVGVDSGATTTENLALASVPDVTLSGTVTDGSGEGWPLYSKITISGYPGGAIYTNPFTGHYSVSLPESATYSLKINPVYQGYTEKDDSVTLGTANKVANEDVEVDATTCTAPGYTYNYSGTSEDFTGWTGNTTQDGWTNVDNEGNGQDWQFNNPGGRTPPPGGDANFAILDSDHYGIGNTENASLVSPVVDLSGQTSPEIGFDTYYDPYPGQTGDVDLSLDGGQTWQTVWSQADTQVVSGFQSIPIPQAAGDADVQVRFHFTGTWGWWWALDNVFIGTQTCVPTNAGLVAGVVKDGNTGNPIDGVKVASSSGDFGVTGPSADPAYPDGLYWLLSHNTGNVQFTASDGNYTPATATVDVAASYVTKKNFTLQAGQVTLSNSSLSVTEQLGAVKTKTVTFTDTGTAPVQVKLSEEGGGFTPMAGDTQITAKGAPLQQIKGTYSPDSAVAAKATSGAKAGASQHAASTPYDPPWTNVANYPTSIQDNAAAYDTDTGDLYSVGGYNGSANVATSYVYAPSSQAWSQIADAPQALENPAGAYLNGKVYVVGGWDSNGNATNVLYAYDPSSNSWTQEANLPEDVSAAATAVLNGQLYVIGGCTTGLCSPTSDAVYSYDPSSNRWTQLASYPSVVAFASCAGLNGEVVCAGGTDADTNQSLTATYIYDPSTDSWSQGANMLFDDWGAAYSGANGQLQIAGGITADGTAATNQAEEYDPSSNTWTALPNANTAEYRGSGACGMFKVGGSVGLFEPINTVEQLPGYDECGTENVPWLAESQTQFTVQPGASVSVTVTFDSSTVSQPGTYTAKLAVQTNTPYSVQPIGISLTVNPPASWGKIDGTVTDASTGSPIAGATIQICTMYIRSTGLCGPVTYTLKTDANGYYQLWLASGYSPLQIIAADNNYQPVAKILAFQKGTTTEQDFTLNKDPSS